MIEAIRQLCKNHSQGVLACVVLCAIGLWMNLVGYSPVFTSIEAGGASMDATIIRSTLYVECVFCGLVLAALGNRVLVFYKRFAIASIIVACLLIFACTLASYYSYRQSFLPPFGVAVCSCFLSAMAYGFIDLIVYLRLSENEQMKPAIITIAIAQIIRLIVSDTLGATAPDSALFIIGTAMPLVAGAALVALFRKPSLGLKEPTLKGKKRIYQTALVFIVGLGMLTVMAFRSTGPTPGLFGSRVDSTSALSDNAIGLLLIIVVFSLLVKYTLVDRTNESVITRYNLPSAVVVVGCLLVAFPTVVATNGVAPSLALQSVTIHVVDLFVHVYQWSLIVGFAKSNDISYPRIFGFNAALANGFALVQINLFSGGTNFAYAVSLLVVFAIVVLMASLPSVLRMAQPQSRESQANRLDAIARKYGLSNRETEVFDLLAQGRDRPYICKNLHLAEGTVKTHTMHIYDKLQISSKQQLIDLILSTDMESEG
jgi:DNA-binding CsgD family transcriptional regulator